jgi:Restriction endonuclease
MIIFTYAFFIFFCRSYQGDGGVDLTGDYKKRQLLVQCKNRNAAICIKDLYAFEGALSRFTKEATFGVFVVSKK